MFNNWSNTQKVLGVIGVIAAVLIIANWNSVWAWVQSLGSGSEDETPKEKTSDDRGDAPVVTPVITIICDPKNPGYDTFGQPRLECGYKPNPAPVTCDVIKANIKYVEAQLSIQPNNPKLKFNLAQLKQQYASKNCEGGPKPGNEQ